MDLGKGTVIADIFLDQKLVVCKGGNLRCVGDAQHLMPFGCLVQKLADTPRRQTRYACVDLIINNGRQGITVGQGALEGQHNAGKLTAGCNLCQRLGLLTGVGGDQKFHGILPVGGQRPPRMLECKTDARHVQKFQRGLHLLVHGGKALQAALGQRLSGLLGGGIQRLHPGLQLGDPLTGGLEVL